MFCRTGEMDFRYIRLGRTRVAKRSPWGDLSWCIWFIIADIHQPRLACLSEYLRLALMFNDMSLSYFKMRLMLDLFHPLVIAHRGLFAMNRILVVGKKCDNI